MFDWQWGLPDICQLLASRYGKRFPYADVFVTCSDPRTKILEVWNRFDGRALRARLHDGILSQTSTFVFFELMFKLTSAAASSSASRSS